MSQNGKGSRPRSNFSRQFRQNFDRINWGRINRKEFLKLPMKERRKILREQTDKLLKVMPNYPNP